MKKRVVILISISIAILTWNLLMSTQRKNLGGRFFPIKGEDVLLKVSCPGKIQPKDQQTIRSELDGRRLITHVTEGKSVKKGDLLMEISDEKIRIELTQKRNQVQNAYADMLNDKKDYGLERSLYKQQAVPKRSVENAKQKFLRSAQSYETQKEELMLVEKKALGAKVVAPMDGVVVRDYFQNQDWITAEKELFTIAKLEHFIVRGSVDELDMTKVKVGQEVQIKCDAFAQQLIRGQVAQIGAQAVESAFGGVDVVIEITDAAGAELKPNLSADASIIVGKIENGIVVPSRAVRTNAQETYVLVKKWGGWLVKRPVNVSHVNYGQAVIAKGLKTDESVLVPKEE